MTDDPWEISRLKISGVDDLRAESWKNRKNQRRPVEAGQRSSDGKVSECVNSK